MFYVCNVYEGVGVVIGGSLVRIWTGWAHGIELFRLCNFKFRSLTFGNNRNFSRISGIFLQNSASETCTSVPGVFENAGVRVSHAVSLELFGPRALECPTLECLESVLQCPGHFFGTPKTLSGHSSPRWPSETSVCRGVKIAAGQFLPLSCRSITLTTRVF